MDSLIAKLYQSPKTILTNKDLALIWQENDKNSLNAKTAYYVKRKALIRLTRGVFAKNKDYNPKELATSIYAPSYISFETVLREAGVIFQHYDAIFVASKWPKTMTIDKHVFTFRKLKDVVLYNSTGIVNRDSYSIATPERAFLDMIYLFPNYYFDNLKSINWEKCSEIVKIYNNKQLIKRFNKYRKNYTQTIPFFTYINYNKNNLIKAKMPEDIEKILKSQKKFLKEKFQVKKIGVFGSFARNEQSANSDIDILVEFYKPIGWDFFDLQEYLESILQREVDLVTENALKPQIKTVILNEVKYA